MKRILLLILILMLIGSGCGKASTETSTVAEPPSESSQGSSRQGRIIVPQKYMDFIKQIRKFSEDETILFYTYEDLDLDGAKEIILASGIEAYGASPSNIYGIFVLREENGKLTQVGGDIAMGGYTVYGIELINLQDLPQRYILLGVTNEASLVGFQIVGLKDGKLETICYSASATGAGEDYLRDSNNDGQYDGFIQNRWSYEVFYYPTISTYKLKDGQFVLDSTTVEIPEHPDNIQDVIIQYLSLIMIDDGHAQEVTNRLSELCKDDETKQDNFKNDTWYNAVYNTIMGIDNMIEFNIIENGDSADATIVYQDDGKNQYKYTFHLLKADSKWYIDKIN